MDRSGRPRVGLNQSPRSDSTAVVARAPPDPLASWDRRVAQVSRPHSEVIEGRGPLRSSTHEAEPPLACHWRDSLFHGDDAPSGLVSVLAREGRSPDKKGAIAQARDQFKTMKDKVKGK